MKEFKLYSADSPPPKGDDLLVIDSSGETHYVFRCNCNNPRCMELRDSITGYHVVINAVKWRII